MKTCSKCGVEKDDILFWKAYVCKECRKEYNKKYYKDNQDKLLNHQKEYYAINKDIINNNKKILRNNKPKLIKIKKIEEKTKICSKCFLEKERNLFCKFNVCKACRKIYNANYQKNNSETIKQQKKVYCAENKDKINKRDKIYRTNNKEALDTNRKEYYKNNKEDILAYGKEYRKNNKEKIIAHNNEYKKKKRKSDPIFKLRELISRAVNISLNGYKNNISILTYLPYTIAELKNHLESRFEQWMNWNNHGIYNSEIWNDSDSLTWAWQLDHIIPQSALPYLSMEDENFKICWALENLRPYSAKQNIIDNNRGLKKNRNSQ
jgi:hypothetical protein